MRLKLPLASRSLSLRNRRGCGGCFLALGFAKSDTTISLPRFASWKMLAPFVRLSDKGGSAGEIARAEP